MLLQFCLWLQGTEFFTAVRQSWYVYPIIMTLHLAGIAVFGGMIVLTDLRLLGVTMRSYPVGDVVNQLRRLKWLGFAVVATCGILMLGSKAEEYYYNQMVWIKLSLLALIGIHGLIFRGSVYRNTSEIDRTAKVPGRAKLAAALSLLLWICVLCAGRGIGYVETPVEKLHAALRFIP